MWQYFTGQSSRQESWPFLLWRSKSFGKTSTAVTWKADYMGTFGCICPNIQESGVLRKKLPGLQTEIKRNRVQKFRSLQKWKSLILVDSNQKEVSFEKVLGSIKSINSLKCFRSKIRLSVWLSHYLQSFSRLMYVGLQLIEVRDWILKGLE